MACSRTVNFRRAQLVHVGAEFATASAKDKGEVICNLVITSSCLLSMSISALSGVPERMPSILARPFSTSTALLVAKAAETELARMNAEVARKREAKRKRERKSRQEARKRKHDDDCLDDCAQPPPPPPPPSGTRR
ncbi:hypothetical protein RI054_11g56100 [Pseudoscourfieldia marina]